MSDLVVLAVTERVARVCQAMVHMKIAVAFPLLNNKPIGAILSGKDSDNDISFEYPILEKFSKHVATTITHALELYESMSP